MFVIADGENMEERIVYDQMRSEERWRDLLDKTRSVIAGSQDVKRPKRHSSRPSSFAVGCTSRR